MDTSEDAADVFAIPDFWKPAKWLDQSIQDIGNRNPFFSLQISAKPATVQLLDRTKPHEPAQDGFFKQPPLLPDSIPSGAVPQHDPEVSSDASMPGSAAPSRDVWLLHDFATAKPPEYRTWEAFAQLDEPSLKTQGPPATFITEAGPSAFDSLCGCLSGASRSDSHEVLGAAGYCACLLALAMGRSSVLFQWDPEKESFVRTMAEIIVSGFSAEALTGLNQICLECANFTQTLKQFVDTTYSVSPTPSTVALADVVDKLLLAIQSELGSRGGEARSVLQLQSIIKPVHNILLYYRDLVGRLAQARRDEHLLSLLFQETQSAEYRDELVRDTACEVLRMVSQPWIHFVEEWIGLRAEEGIVLTKDGPGKSFVKVGNKMWIDDQGFELEEPDFFLDEEKMPTFMPKDTALAIFETGRNYRFIKQNHPEHPLAERNVIASSNPPVLQWEFCWDAITKLEERAKEYEADVSRALQKAHLAKSTQDGAAGSLATRTSYGLEFFGRDEGQITAGILASMSRFEEPFRTPMTKDSLGAILKERLFDAKDSNTGPDKKSTPHWSLLPLLSFGPLVTVQARLVNRECLKLLFNAHNLRAHLDLQRQYHLLGNGLFCSRLSHALFDPDLDTAERQAGVALTGGNMGLRLNGRDSWPPASSELRLALMGVVSDSYQSLVTSNRQMQGAASSSTLESKLPGDISFAVRDLSPEAIERCVNPDALEALDFLRLSYKPPPPLRPIFTPIIMLKYDRVFQLLLRALRMLYVGNQLFRDISALPQSDSPASDDAILRFRIEAHGFVSQITAYFFTNGIAEPWQRFEAWLSAVDADGDGDRQRTMHSPDRLREHQERVLDQIMFSLLLRKRQAPVLKLLEEIFEVILRFAKMVRLRAMGRVNRTDDDRPEQLYARFRRKVEVFITVCKGLHEKSTLASKSERRGNGGDVGTDGTRSGSGIEQLLLKLDMLGYYSKKPYA